MQQNEKWLVFYEELEIKIQTTKSQIENKKQQEKVNQFNSRQNITIRKSLTEIQTLTSKLFQDLKEMNSDLKKYRLTPVEYKRRKKNLQDKKRDFKKLQQDFATQPIEALGAKKWKDSLIKETLETQGFNNDELMEIDNASLEKQEDYLDQISVSVQRQTEIATTLNEELDEESYLLDGLDKGMTNITPKMKKNTKKVSKYAKVSKMKGLICLVIFLILLLSFLLFLLFTERGAKFLKKF
ncbi:syntaxin-51-related [Anaeramoeba flamelloides]|uniref:Syntaxin-51-related n=1 Tax=Anaeramoeba flamelloides TaxID=1746091 RepID=A0AAV8A4D6_9EUKA|nr:syntaxin-51-related [Anaeramoeba flamelloides]